MKEQPRIFLLLGSNLGDRSGNLQSAIGQLETAGIKILRKSAVYVTEPWGMEDQPEFLNQVIELQTDLLPREILSLTQKIENQAGPQKDEKWGPRHLDIDILFNGDQIIDEDDLKVPHPELHKRNFTLIPLMEIAGDFMHPVFGKTIHELYQESTDTVGVKKLQEA